MKRSFFLIVLILFTFSIHGADLTPKYLFINSTPIRAKVIIDGVDKGLLTPCVIKNLDASNKILKIKKDGYKDRIVYLSNVKSKKIDIYMATTSFDIYFPERTKYKISDLVKEGPLYVSNLESGTYNINIKDEKIVFNRIGPFVPAEISVGTSLALSLIYTGISIGLAEYYAYQSESTLNDFDSRHYDLVARGFDISKYVGISLTAVLALTITGIIIADVSMRYKYKQKQMEISSDFPIDDSRRLYESAIEYLTSGDVQKSTNILLSLTTLYPNNDYMPLIYYQLGQNFFILKDYNNALLNWEIFVNDYPVADYYDYVLKNIAEIHYMRKEYSKALGMLDKVVFTENILDRETIFSFKAKLLFELFYFENENSYFKIAESDYLTLIENFENSDRLHYYYLQLIKLYIKEGKTDKLNELKKKAETITEPSVRKLVLSYF